MRELDMYLERAAECRTQANAATLPNVKERCLRAEEAWSSMAARAERHESLRAKSAADKSAALMDADISAMPAAD
jgi:hypothetical protein